MLEEVELELLGERDCKDGGGPGEPPRDELLHSGVWPAKTHTFTQMLFFFFFRLIFCVDYFGDWLLPVLQYFTYI